jgi:hypothetical protein
MNELSGIGRLNKNPEFLTLVKLSFGDCAKAAEKLCKSSSSVRYDSGIIYRVPEAFKPVSETSLHKLAKLFCAVDASLKRIKDVMMNKEKNRNEKIYFILSPVD